VLPSGKLFEIEVLGKMEMQTKVSDVQQCVGPHKIALQWVSSLYGVPLPRLESHLRERLEGNNALATRLRETSEDETQAKLIALAAVLSAENYLKDPQGAPPEHPARVAFRIESLRVPVLRDTLYSRYWLGNSIEDISQHQKTRVITVRQNLKRGLKRIFSSEKFAEDSLSGWRSRGAGRRSCDVPEEALVEALFQESLACELPPSAQEALVDALAASAREMALENVLVVGARSLRAEQGRAWIEPERRPGALDLPRAQVAESPAVYDSARVYSVSHPEQKWSVRLVHRPEAVEVVWQEGNVPIVVRGPAGEILGVCGESSKRVVMSPCQPPLRISLRPTQQVP
jgi:hypothetical protein